MCSHYRLSPFWYEKCSLERRRNHMLKLCIKFLTTLYQKPAGHGYWWWAGKSEIGHNSPSRSSWATDKCQMCSPWIKSSREDPGQVQTFPRSWARHAPCCGVSSEGHLSLESIFTIQGQSGLMVLEFLTHPWTQKPLHGSHVTHSIDHYWPWIL